MISAEERKKADRGELDFWEYDELGYIIAGTPERVEQRVRALVTEFRIGQLITCMHMGNLPEEVAALNNELFATSVIPKLRNVWSEYEDRWTPRVSQERIAETIPDAGPGLISIDVAAHQVIRSSSSRAPPDTSRDPGRAATLSGNQRGRGRSEGSNMSSKAPGMRRCSW